MRKYVYTYIFGATLTQTSYLNSLLTLLVHSKPFKLYESLNVSNFSFQFAIIKALYFKCTDCKYDVGRNEFYHSTNHLPHLNSINIVLLILS